MRKITYCHFLAGFLLCALGTSAQQTPLSIFYRSNWQMINPAAIDRGLYLSRHHNTWMVNSAFRQQWIGLEGAPRTYFVSFEYCPETGSTRAGHRIGGTVLRDQTDALSNTSLHANYSFFFPLPYKRGHIIHLGFTPGIVSSNLDLEKLRLRDQNDPVPYLYENRLFFDFAFGAMYRVRQEFYLGLSVPQFVNIKLNQFDLDSARVFRKPHVYLHIGGFIQAGEWDYGDKLPDQREWVIEPSAWIRYAPRGIYSTLIPSFPLSLDASVRVYRKRALWGGIGYGTNGMASVEFGLSHMMSKENKIQAGVAYSVPAAKKYLNLGHSIELTASYWWW
ncbi:MAG: type IX secretion system membrane protein PorP/SprF [Haliscomenobacteraceae bacterium CHB4]|nr:type IX secretion system membrane protein PorP/SprF [Haliscomenobacteraceae bacterium CHB4]